MRKIAFLLFFMAFCVQAQEKDTVSVKSVTASIELYKYYNLKKDTIQIDTSLTILDEYRYNYLRKDNFGLLPFANEGYLHTQLDFSKKKSAILPQFGFNAKHITYLEADDINYYSVPTPYTDLYFKTVMRQGQSLDALLSVNTKRNLNFTIANKSIRSIGDYYNNLTSSGHFRFSTSYYTLNKKYYLNAHFAGQDIFNQENGGISNLTQFEIENPAFIQRERLDVYFNDASSKLKGNRFFIDHSYKFREVNSLVFKHQFSYENKFYEFIQNTPVARLGVATTQLINNKTRFNALYNKFGVSFLTKKLGELQFFIDQYATNTFYNTSNVFTPIASLPSNLRNTIVTLGGQYEFYHAKWRFVVLAQNGLSSKPTSNFEVTATYKIDQYNAITISGQQTSKIPDNTYVLSQSSYQNFNWYNSFANEKISKLNVEAKTKWLNVSGQYSLLTDHLYFYNTQERIDSLMVKPFQYGKTIQYYAVEIAKEIKYKKFALDNRIKFQQVTQEDAVLNVPKFIIRNTFYYTNAVFKKAMLLQMGVTCNYFTKYYADDYIPVIGEFYVQKNTKIGEFPLLDFFVNARVKQTRIYLKAEHINALFGKNDYYNAPNYPFRDFKIRFGLEWNFFK